MPTIGVAVAVPEPRAKELQRYRASLGDLTASRIPTHITLVPPTGVAQEDLAEVEEHLSAAARDVSAFRVRLRGTGTFRPVSPVVFVALAEGGAGCEALADAARRGPLARELEFAYHPHVTIAHHLPDDVLDRALDDLAGFDHAFWVRELQLYTHDAGNGWVPTRTFALSGADAGQ